MAKSRFKPFLSGLVKESAAEAWQSANDVVIEILERSVSWSDGLRKTNLVNARKFKILEDTAYYLRIALEHLDMIEIPSSLLLKRVTMVLWPQGSPARQYNRTTRTVRLVNAGKRLQTIAAMLTDEGYPGLVMGIEAAIESMKKVSFFQYSMNDKTAALEGGFDEIVWRKVGKGKKDGKKTKKDVKVETIQASFKNSKEENKKGDSAIKRKSSDKGMAKKKGQDKRRPEKVVRKRDRKKIQRGNEKEVDWDWFDPDNIEE